MNAISVGLSISEMEQMEIGMLFDLFISKNNMYILEKQNVEEEKKPKIRKATQRDFDIF